jgi:hypothetical protein
LTLNYLKPFEPGEPIDINVLNKLIMNVNFLASQIAQIYRLPAMQAPVTLSGAVGGTSGTGTGGSSTDGSGASDGVSSSDVVHITIPKTTDFRKTGQVLTHTVSTAEVEKAAGKKIKSFKVLSAGFSNPTFTPSKKAESVRSAASAATINKITVAGAMVSFVQAKLTGWKASVNGPATSGTYVYYRFYWNLELTVEVTF